MFLDKLIDELEEARRRAWPAQERTIRVGLVAANEDDFVWLEADITAVQLLMPNVVIQCRVSRQQELDVFQRQDDFEEQAVVQVAEAVADQIVEDVFAPSWYELRPPMKCGTPAAFEAELQDPEAAQTARLERMARAAIERAPAGSLQRHAKEIWFKYWSDLGAEEGGAEFGLEWERAAVLGLVLTPGFPETAHQVQNACQTILGHIPPTLVNAPVYQAALELEKRP